MWGNRLKPLTKHVTVTAVWIKVLEVPEPIVMPMTHERRMREGDTLTIELNLNDLVTQFGTDYEEEQ